MSKFSPGMRRRLKKVNDDAEKIGRTIAAGVDVKRGRAYVEFGGISSAFYNPAETIARNLQEAMALGPTSAQGKVLVDNGAAGCRIRGEILKETQHAVFVLAYGRKTWLKRKWLLDSGEGWLRVSVVGMNRSFLGLYRRKAKALRDRLAALRSRPGEE